LTDLAIGVRVCPGAGARLNDLMFRARLSRSDLAERAGVSRDTLHSALNDRLSTKTAKKLAAALNVDADAILFPAFEGVAEETQPYDVGPSEAGRELEDFFGSVERVIRTLSSATGAAPMDPKSKLAILNGIEEAARLAGQKLPPEFWRLRQIVVEGG
jgi:transcriptional regulator with XRE-family HTH domain